jgi:hypothetical protein
MAWRRVYNQARGLVQHKKRIILIENIQRDLLRNKIQRFRFW